MNTMKKLVTCTAATVLAAAFAGCTAPGQAAKATSPAAAQNPFGGIIAGKVVETVDAGGYTYVNLEKDGKNTWVALPVTKVTVGQELKVLPGGEMPNFTSKTLNRTFDKIIFSGGLVDQPAKPAAPAVAGVEDSAEVVMAGKVIETMNAASYTYIRVEKDGKAAWAAVPSARIAVGDEVELAPGTPMGQFSSKTLNRTFNSIYFAGGVTVTSRKTPLAEAPAAPAAAPAAPAAEPQLPSGHPKIGGAETGKAVAPPAAMPPITGKVVETTDGGGYTYICLEKDGQKTWAAVPTMTVKVGEELSLNPGNVMNNFSSKTLNRTFDKIVFSSGPAAK